MAAILKLRRGTSASPALTDGEVFLNYTTGSIQYASGSSVYSLLPLDRLIDGNIVLNGNITASNLKLSGDATIDGNIVLGGSIFLGTGDVSDEIIVNSSLSGSLIPDNDAEYDLGSLSKRYNNLYVVSASIEDIKLPGSGILSSSNTDFSDYTSSVENRLTNIESETSSLDLRLDDEEAKSVILQTLTASYDDRLLQLETETGSIETEQSVQDERLTNLELDSASQDNRLDNLELTSQSHDDRITQLETDTGSQDNRLDNLELTSQSHDDRLGQLEVDSGSQDGRLTNLELTSASHDDRISQIETETGSLSSRLDVEEEKSTTLTNLTASYEDRLNQLESDSGSQDGRLDNLELTSASHESRLDLLSDVSHSHSNKANLDTIDQDLATTSTVTFNTGSFTGNVTVNGNLTVLGSATEISTTELSIEDKLITLASGSADSTTADGAGIYIDGANKSLTWDHNTTSFVLDAKVSSSVGFKGDGSELTDIQHENINFGGSNIVSGSSQVTSSLDLRYLEINGDSVVSSSAQIVYGDISSIPSNIVSSSTDSSNIDFTITEGNISANLYGGVVSGSSQVTQSLDLRYLEINGDDVVSGSSQVTQSLDERYEERASSIHTIVSSSQQVIDFLPNGTVSGSSQVTSSLDLRYEVVGNGIVSGSSQVTSSLDLRYLQINGDDVVSGSSFVSNHQGVLTASINDADTNVDLGLKESDSPTFSGLSLSSLSELGSGELNALISGSAGSVGYRVLGTAAFLNVSNSIDNDQTVIPTNFAVNQALIAAGAGDITSVNPSSTYGSGETTGLLHNGDGTDVGGVYGTQGDIVIEIATGSAHFLGGIKAKLDADGVLSSSAQFDDLFNIDGIVSGSDQVTQSLDLRYLEINGDDVVSGSEQIVDVLTSINAYTQSNDNDISNLELTSASHDDRLSQLETETGSIETEQDVQDQRLGSLESFTSSLDDDFVTQTELAAATGALENVDTSHGDRLSQLETETGSIETEQSVQDSRLNQLSFETASISDEQAVQDDRLSQIEAVTASLDGLYEEKSSGTHTLVSGSSQIIYGDISSIPSNIVSQSTDSANIDFTITNGNITANLKGGIVSGSDQFTGSFVTLDTDQTINGTKTFNDIVVNGTGSFAYITSVAGDAKIIGDNYIILNNDTPTQRYAGIKVFDSGSANTTASLEYDGQNNDWFYQYTDDGGVTDEFGVVLFGPEYSGKGTPTYPTNNTIQKGNGGHHLLDSNITDNGTLITLGSSVDVSGITNFNDTTQSTSKTTGAVVIDGGVGIAKTLNVGEDVVAYASSDRRLKDNIQPISNPLEKINQISGNSFVWNEEKQNIYKGKDYGVIAQEIEEILPELVQTRENGYKAVKYDKIVSLLIEGIKELSKEVTDLKNKLE